MHTVRFVKIKMSINATLSFKNIVFYVAVVGKPVVVLGQYIQGVINIFVVSMHNLMRQRVKK